MQFLEDQKLSTDLLNVDTNQKQTNKNNNNNKQTNKQTNKKGYPSVIC